MSASLRSGLRISDPGSRRSAGIDVPAARRANAHSQAQPAPKASGEPPFQITYTDVNTTIHMMSTKCQ
jgi:hypothetical protein